MSCIPTHNFTLLQSFGGFLKRYEYDSECCGCPITLTVYFPPAAETGRVPVIYYLASLTTDDETFVNEALPQQRASELGLALVCSDSSPRNIPGVEEQGEWPHQWRYGYANSWYLNATTDKFRSWQIQRWIGEELPRAVAMHFPSLDTQRASLMGFSMGGHGALTVGLRYAPQYRSISALAPVCSPASSPVGESYYSAALGPDKEAWKQYDASELAKRYEGPPRNFLLDTGSLEHWPVVNPHVFAEAAKFNKNLSVTNRIQEGYSHDFAFVATFVGEHLEWHMQHLRADL